MPSGCKKKKEIKKVQLTDSQILYKSFIHGEKIPRSFPNIFLATINNAKFNHLKSSAEKGRSISHLIMLYNTANRRHEAKMK